MKKDEKQLFRETEARLHNYKDLSIQIKSIELDIEEKEIELMDYRGCGAISYDERTGTTYSINKTVENEAITREKKEKEIRDLLKEKRKKELEKRKIENALTSLDIIETDFFNLFYNSRNKHSMVYISRKMHTDRSYLYVLREKLVNKAIGILYPDYSDLPLLK